MMTGFGRVLSLVLVCPCLFVFTLLMFGVTPRSLWVRVVYEIKMARERAIARRAEREPVAEKPHTSRQKTDLPPSGVQQPLCYTDDGDEEEKSPLFGHRKKKVADVDTEEDEIPDNPTSHGVIDEDIFDEVLRRTREREDVRAITEKK